MLSVGWGWGIGKGGHRLWRLALAACLPEAASVAPAGFSSRICTHCGGLGEQRSLSALVSGKSHDQRSLVGYSSWGHKELDPI